MVCVENRARLSPSVGFALPALFPLDKLSGGEYLAALLKRVAHIVQDFITTVRHL